MVGDNMNKPFNVLQSLKLIEHNYKIGNFSEALCFVYSGIDTIKLLSRGDYDLITQENKKGVELNG